MPSSVFWAIVALFLNTSDPMPAVDNLVTAINPSYQHQQNLQKQEQDQGYIHTAATIIDGHNDTMMNIIDEDTWLPKTDIGESTSFHLDIPKLQEGGLDAAFFAAYTSGFYGNTPRSVSRTLALLNALYWTEKNNPDQIAITSNSLEIISTTRNGKIAAIPTIEGGYSFDEHNALELLHQYRDLGVKVIGFNWNYSNALGEGANRVYGDAAKTPSQGGLTELGTEVVAEMNRLGIVVDVSHMSENTFWDVIETTKSPVMATHSGVQALKNHQRNLTDDQLKALAENGGVIGIVFYPAFLTDKPEAYVTDIVDHIDYVVQLIGIDHIALGSDFDGSEMASDIQDATDLHKVTDELINRGYSDESIEKILGKNTLRLLVDVEARATDNFYKTTDLKIDAAFDMGEIISTSTPLLTADVKQSGRTEEENVGLDAANFRVIVDGISHEPDYNSETSTLSLQLPESLEENFHVVTFEAKTRDGQTQRDTTIFYIEK